MDTSLRLGEDIDLGYRLAECGAVFVADREARAWHLGRTHQQQRQDEVNDYNQPFLTNRVPDLQPQRRRGRLYAVPYLEVVLDTRGEEHGAVQAVVDSVLASSLADLSVTLLGDWSAISEERSHPLDDPQKSARLLRESYAGEPRVTLAESLPAPAGQFRMTLGSAAWAPTAETLGTLVLHLERTHHGLRQVMMPDGSSARVERTAAYARARKVAEPGEDLDDVVDELFGSWWVEAGDAGFEPSATIRRPRLRGTAGVAQDPAEAWRELGKEPPRQQPAKKASGAGGGAEAARPLAAPWLSCGSPTSSSCGRTSVRRTPATPRSPCASTPPPARCRWCRVRSGHG